jgi:hypothetical protein
MRPAPHSDASVDIPAQVGVQRLHGFFRHVVTDLHGRHGGTKSDTPLDTSTGSTETEMGASAESMFIHFSPH